MRSTTSIPPTDSQDDPNPAFTLFANDVLCWEPWHWLTDGELGQAFKLIVYATKLGSRLPKNHPLLAFIDRKVIDLCTRDEGEHLAVVQPVDLPKLILARQEYLDARRQAGAKGGKVAAERRRQGKLHAV